MTDRELMQIALRALKNAYSFIPMKMMEHHLQAEDALRDRLAKPEWVGLTDEEVGGLTVFSNGLHDVEVPILADLIRAVEDKLKEKNS